MAGQSSLRSLGVKFRPLSKRFFSSSQALSGALDKDFFPSECPENEDERKRAAKKFFMHPNDYKPFNDAVGMGTGDYPNVDLVGDDVKDQHEDFDMPDLKRNFMEPVPLDIDALWCYDYGKKPKTPVYRQALHLATVVVIFYGFCFLMNDFSAYRHPFKPKQMLYNLDLRYQAHQDISEIKRQVHYTFEPATKP